MNKVIKLDDLKPFPGSRHREKRVGRGHGSGHGKTSCRGHKGQKARKSPDIRPWFEGGQTPIYRKIPKVGFVNPFKVEYEVVNIKDLVKRFQPNEIVNLDTLKEKGLVKGKDIKVKILGDGEIDFPLVVRVHAISKSAKEKIEKAGGKVELER